MPKRTYAFHSITPAHHRILNDEGVPSPKAGRSRRVGGIDVPNSGLWTQNTVKHIATHPLLIAICEYGRRAMGDQLRLTPAGPRVLGNGDYWADGRPRSIVNPPDATIRSAASFDPLISPERHAAIAQILEKRGEHLKGKARPRRNSPNPLGGRIYDLNCGWLMYRHARRGGWGYQCGLYQNSHAQACSHNVVPGEATTRFVLSCLRQRVLAPSTLAKLKVRLGQIAAAESKEDPVQQQRDAIQGELATVERKLATVGRNMALAETPEERQAIATVFRELQVTQVRLSGQRGALRPAEKVQDIDGVVGRALAGLDRLHELSVATEADSESIGELLRQVDAKLYLGFRAESRGRRTINVPSGGVLTFGSSPPPGPLYQGPTDRAIIRRKLADGEPVCACPVQGAPGSSESGAEVNWSANVQRGTRSCSGPGPQVGFRWCGGGSYSGRSAEPSR